jgi:hypothetical protein
LAAQLKLVGVWVGRPEPSSLFHFLRASPK